MRQKRIRVHVFIFFDVPHRTGIVYNNFSLASSLLSSLMHMYFSDTLSAGNDMNSDGRKKTIITKINNFTNLPYRHEPPYD